MAKTHSLLHQQFDHESIDKIERIRVALEKAKSIYASQHPIKSFFKGSCFFKSFSGHSNDLEKLCLFTIRKQRAVSEEKISPRAAYESVMARLREVYGAATRAHAKKHKVAKVKDCNGRETDKDSIGPHTLYAYGLNTWPGGHVYHRCLGLVLHNYGTSGDKEGTYGLEDHQNLFSRYDAVCKKR